MTSKEGTADFADFADKGDAAQGGRSRSSGTAPCLPPFSLLFLIRVIRAIRGQVNHRKSGTWWNRSLPNPSPALATEDLLGRDVPAPIQTFNRLGARDVSSPWPPSAGE